MQYKQTINLFSGVLISILISFQVAASTLPEYTTEVADVNATQNPPLNAATLRPG